MSIDTLKKRFKDELIEHELIRNHIAFKVGGVADYFLVAKDIDDIIDAITLAQEINLPYLVLGEGNTVVFSDFGFPGLVIQNSTTNICFLMDRSQVIVDSGVKLSTLLMMSANRDLGGIEFLGGINGSVGGVLYNNSSNNRITIEPNLKKITLLSNRGEILTYKSAWLKLGPCSSRLKKEKISQDKLVLENKATIILTATLQLQRSRQEDILRRINQNKAHMSGDKASIGPIFIDPIDKNATDLLRQSGSNRLKIGDAVVDWQNPNRIINRKSAQSSDVKKLIEQMKQLVLDKAGVELEENVEYVGVW